MHKEGIHIAIQTIYNHVHADASGRLAKHMPHELTERSTNFILMEKLKCGRKAVPTAKVVARLLFPYREFVHTITTDNGCEFAAHLEITRMLSRGGRERGKVYFADSYCSWQKGAIENANKLIRKYIPKKANFDDFSDTKIMKIQKKINRRPREKINFDSPKDRYFKHFYKYCTCSRTLQMTLYDEKYRYSRNKYLNMALIAKYEISIHIFPFCSSLDIG